MLHLIGQKNSYLLHMFYILLKFCQAFFNGQQTLQTICLWVLKKKNQMAMCELSPQIYLFYLLEEHLQGWFDDLQVAAELAHNVLQGILQDHMLKFQVLSQKIVILFLTKFLSAN